MSIANIDYAEYQPVLPGFPPTWYTDTAIGNTKAAPVTGGIKFDDGKTRYDLVPPEALEGLAKVLTFGAAKYADRNWEKGMPWGRVFASMMRHAWAWWRGEDKDPETGFSHMEHVICNAAFLITYEKRDIGNDNRNI